MILMRPAPVLTTTQVLQATVQRVVDLTLPPLLAVRTILR